MAEVETKNDEKEVLEAITLFTAKLSSSGCFTESVERLSTKALEACGLHDAVLVTYPNMVQIETRSFVRMIKFDTKISANVSNEAQISLEHIIDHPQDCFVGDWLKTRVDFMKNISPLYNRYVQFFVWVLNSMAVNILFYDGSANSLGVTFVCSCCTFLTASLAPAFNPSIANATGFLGAYTAAMLSKFAVTLNFIDGACLTGCVISAMISIIPGTAITLGVADVVADKSVQGVSRLVGALANSFMQGVAIVCGYATIFWFETPQNVTTKCPDPLNQLFIILFLPILWISWIIKLDSPRKLYLPLAISALISWGCWYGLRRASTPLVPEFVDIIASFAIGIGAWIQHELFKISEFPMTVIGIYLFVPGTTSVLGIANVILGNPQAFGINILLIAIHVSIGLSLARIVKELFFLTFRRIGLEHFHLPNAEFTKTDDPKKIFWQLHLK